jgi:hypothetical protein
MALLSFWLFSPLSLPRRCEEPLPPIKASPSCILCDPLLQRPRAHTRPVITRGQANPWRIEGRKG